MLSSRCLRTYEPVSEEFGGRDVSAASIEVMMLIGSLPFCHPPSLLIVWIEQYCAQYC